MSANGYMDDLHKWLRRVPFIEDMVTSGELTIGHVNPSSGLSRRDLIRIGYRMEQAHTRLYLGETPLSIGNSNRFVVITANRYIPRKYFVESGTSPEQEVLVDNKPVGWMPHVPAPGVVSDGAESAFALPSVVAAMMYAELVYGDRK